METCSPTLTPFQMRVKTPLVLCSFRNNFVLNLLTDSHLFRETLLFGIVKNPELQEKRSNKLVHVPRVLQAPRQTRKLVLTVYPSPSLNLSKHENYRSKHENMLPFPSCLRAVWVNLATTPALRSQSSAVLERQGCADTRLLASRLPSTKTSENLQLQHGLSLSYLRSGYRHLHLPPEQAGHVCTLYSQLMVSGLSFGLLYSTSAL